MNPYKAEPQSAALPYLPQSQHPRHELNVHQMVRGHPVYPLAYGDRYCVARAPRTQASHAPRTKMGMTGVEPASFGLKDRCITGLLHTLTSHTGRWAVIGLEPIFQGPKSRVLTIYTRPQVHRWIRTIPNGVADHPDHQVLRADRSRVRTAHNKERVRFLRTRWTVFESNELLRCFKPPLLRVSLLSGSSQRDSNPYLHLERVATCSG